jgi:hypothetical protein
MRLPASMLACLVVLLPASGALAQGSECTASVEGSDITLSNDSNLEPASSTLGWLWGGDDDTCPPELVLAYLTPLLQEDERLPFCLMYDRDAETITGFAQGERADDLTCKVPSAFCERVNNTADTALALAGVNAEAGLLENTGNVAGRVQAARDAAGNTIVKGAAGVVSGALGSMGATALSAMTAPAAVAAATVTIVAAGGAVYVCR